MSWLLLNSQWDISKALEYRWNITEDLTKNLPYSWNILENVTGSLAFSWDIKGFVTGGLAFSWNILGNVSGVLGYSWDINTYFSTARPQFAFYADAVTTSFQSTEESVITKEFSRSRMR